MRLHCIRGILVSTSQGLFQDFASEGENAKFQNSGGGGGGNLILKGRKSQSWGGGGGTDPKGGQKHPLAPPEINPASD